MPSPGLTIFGMAGNYAARRSGIVRGRTVGTQQIAFAAASNGERAPNLARIDQEWPSLVAERGEHPDGAENEHHNEHDGDDDQDRLDHNRICMPVRASAPSAPRFLSMRSCAPPALHWLIHGVMPNSSRPARSQSSAARACRTASAGDPCAAYHRAAPPCNAAT